MTSYGRSGSPVAEYGRSRKQNRVPGPVDSRALQTSTQTFFYASSAPLDTLFGQMKIIKFDLDGNVEDLFVPDPVIVPPGHGTIVNYSQPIVSNDGKMAFYVTDFPYDMNSSVAVALFGQANLKCSIDGVELPRPEGWYVFGHHAWSPDGSKIVNAVLKTFQPNYQLIVTNPDLSSPVELNPSTGPIAMAEPSWTDDGITAMKLVAENDARPLTVDPADGTVLWGPYDTPDSSGFDPYRQGDLVLYLVSDLTADGTGIRLYNITNDELTWAVPLGSRQDRITDARWVAGMTGKFVLSEQEGLNWKVWMYDIENLANPEPISSFATHGSVNYVGSSTYDY